ncbi:hypothetical protein HDU67_001043 [Dinochytrium kinnereticum]|nr:hypothetical protein HDU67_001043 [Dinochytrium kinnereticum]
MRLKTNEPCVVLAYCRTSKQLLCKTPIGIQALWTADVLQHSYRQTFNSALKDCGKDGCDEVLWAFVGLLFDVTSPRPFGGRRRTGYLEFQPENESVLDFVIQRLANPARFARVKRSAHNDIVKHVVMKMNHALGIFNGGDFETLQTLASRGIERSQGAFANSYISSAIQCDSLSSASSCGSTPTFGSPQASSYSSSPLPSPTPANLPWERRTKYVMSSRAFTPSYDATNGESVVPYYVPPGSETEGMFTYDPDTLEFFTHSPSVGSTDTVPSPGPLSSKISCEAVFTQSAIFESSFSTASDQASFPTPPLTWSYSEEYSRCATPSYDAVNGVIIDHTWSLDGQYHPIYYLVNEVRNNPSRPSSGSPKHSVSRKRKCQSEDEVDMAVSKRVKHEPAEEDDRDVCSLGCCGGDRTGRLPSFWELDRYRMMHSCESFMR